MKITLDSNNEIHRKIGLMYGVYTMEVGFTSERLFYKHADDFYFIDPTKEITIDLYTAEPDLRLAIGEGMEFEVSHVCEYFDLGYKEKVEQVKMTIDLFSYLKEPNENFSGIRLSREWLESQGVEVSE